MVEHGEAAAPREVPLHDRHQGPADRMVGQHDVVGFGQGRAHGRVHLAVFDQPVGLARSN